MRRLRHTERQVHPAALGAEVPPSATVLRGASLSELVRAAFGDAYPGGRPGPKSYGGAFSLDDAPAASVRASRMTALNAHRQGSGRPLLLIHGLGGSWRSWSPILDDLAAERQVIAIDLPGHGATPSLPGRASFERLADATEAFLTANDLGDVDLAGSSMGARLVLELARRGRGSAVVSLDPGGFWQGWERRFFKTTIAASIMLVRALRPMLPEIAQSTAARTAFLAQLSARPWSLPPDLVRPELEGYAACPVFDDLVHDLAGSPMQLGASVTPGPITIVWGRQDRLCLPRQAQRAMRRFPKARLHWLDHCGHFPQWDQPAATARLILKATARAGSIGD